MPSLFTGITLSLIVVATELEIPTTAKNLNFIPDLGCQFSFLSASTNSTTSTSSTSLASLEEAVHAQVNQYRATRDLPSLSLDLRISEQARVHSQNMANGTVSFGHDGFGQRVQAISRVIPYRAAAENVAYNQGYANPDRQAIQGWIKSDGHRTNIEGQYNWTGIGIAKNSRGEYYFTQIFVNAMSMTQPQAQKSSNLLGRYQRSGGPTQKPT